VEEDGARQDEGPDEEKHQRVGKRGEDFLGRGHPQHHTRRGTDQRGNRERQCLSDPEDHDRRQHSRQTVRRRRQSRHRQREEQDEDGRGENGSDAVTHSGYHGRWYKA